MKKTNILHVTIYLLLVAHLRLIEADLHEGDSNCVKFIVEGIKEIYCVEYDGGEVDEYIEMVWRMAHERVK